jgi:hypothetical protein
MGAMAVLSLIMLDINGLLLVHAEGGEPPQQSNRAFDLNLSRRVALISGDHLLRGRLDRDGNFLIEARYPRNSLYSGPRYELINAPVQVVYEFRSGRLIKGEIINDGRFVPEIGSEVIDIKDYKYSPGAIRIYNLPGRFVEADPKTGRTR